MGKSVDFPLHHAAGSRNLKFKYLQELEATGEKTVGCESGTYDGKNCRSKSGATVPLRTYLTSPVFI
jgi:hypothetical protein